MDGKTECSSAEVADILVWIATCGAWVWKQGAGCHSGEYVRGEYVASRECWMGLNDDPDMISVALDGCGGLCC